MASFSIVVVTAPPPGQAAEAGGAYIKIDGREALLRSVELFLNRDNVRQIQLVVAQEDFEEAKRKFGAHLGFSGVKLVSSGVKWMEQATAAAKTLADEPTHVILHDAARPIVPYSDIDAVMAAADEHDAAALTAPLRATLVEVDEGGGAMAYHMPGQFAQLLTPWMFSRAKFLEMTTSGREVHPSAVTLVKGSPLNVRVGGAGDERLARAMLGMLPKPKMKPTSGPFDEAQW